MASRQTAPRRATRKDFESRKSRMQELWEIIFQETLGVFGLSDDPQCEARIAEALQEMREIVGADKYWVRRISTISI